MYITHSYPARTGSQLPRGPGAHAPAVYADRCVTAEFNNPASSSVAEGTESGRGGYPAISENDATSGVRLRPQRHSRVARHGGGGGAAAAPTVRHTPGGPRQCAAC